MTTDKQNASKGEKTNPLLQAALDYAQKGWQVFPVYEIKSQGKCACGLTNCTSPGKHPRTQYGLKDAKTEEKQIRRWWRKWPDANIGIRTGHESGMCVVDIDKKTGGFTSLEQLEKLHGELPLEVVAFSGGGSLHIYFNYPTSLEIKSRSMALGEGFPGIDTKANQAYIIAPPSSHISGKFYSWESMGKLPEMPNWLIKLLTTDSEKALRATSDVIVEGNRNNVLTSLAGKYHSLGLSQNVIIEKLLDDNKKLCQPPLSEKEVISIAKSISRYLWPLANACVNSSEPQVLQANWQYLNEIDCKDVAWLWTDFIAVGKLNMIVGNPDMGKSWVALFIAAKVTTGDPWPNLFRRQEPGSVIILSAEDSPDDTIRPRFESSGGDSSRAIFLEGMRDEEGTDYFFDMTRDICSLEEVIQQHSDVRLIIIDPLSAHCGATDTHVDAKVRRVLGPLANLARKYEIAIVGISHLNKSQQKEILYKPGGSIAFVAAARSIMLVTYNPKDQESRIFHIIKSNLTANKFGLVFKIQNDNLLFEPDEVSLSAEELLAAISSKRESPATNRAVTWLTEYFRQAGGPVRSKVAEEDAKKAGISKYAFNRACSILGGKRRKVGNDENGYWEMYIPEEADNEVTNKPPEETDEPQDNNETEEID